ncbi:MAG: sigma-54 factor interaction protein [Gemmatimonadetes bacterium]|jgi:DNA-binding NtrC family response regulator|nr:sigma-54 factor interaction protein [Gemmatimonadota bacterium]
MATILYLDDEPAIGLILADTLERAGHTAIGAQTVPQALQALAEQNIDLIISDYRMPGLTGLEFLELLKEEGSTVPLIMLTGYATIEHAVAAIKAGAIDYITKPVSPDQLELAVSQALEVVRLRRENTALRREVMEFRNERAIIGETPQIRRLMQTVATAAPTRATVLLQGESGTGKELFARAIHDASDRRDKPFIKLNCAALPEGLIESALFGHEKGAFTGAIKRVEGAFERAHHGTLLLDEVSEMRLDLQAKLLRVLQEQEFERVGGSQPIKVDVRIIATTNRDLATFSAEGHFRQDLFFRLSVLPVSIPPLRDRRQDIPLLAQRFALRTAAEMNKDIVGVAPEALAMLQEYDWPGNVRELQHAVERAVILSPERVLQVHAFDGVRFGLSRNVTGPTRPKSHTLAEGKDAPVQLPPGAVVLTSLNVDEAEQQLIARALDVSAGNRTRAAELLGMSIRTLRSKLNRPGEEPSTLAD